MFCQAFPSLQPQAELQWLSERGLVCASLDEELRVCQTVCRLVELVVEHSLVAEHPVNFLVRGARNDNDLHSTNSPFYFLLYRSLCAAKAFVGGWSDPMDAVSLTQLRHLTGIFHFIHDNMPEGQKTKAAIDMPVVLEAWNRWYPEVATCIEWAERLTDPNLVNAPLPAGIQPTTGKINWAMYRAVHDATWLFRNGQYSSAGKMYRDAQFVHHWQPSPSVLRFLADLKAYTDLAVASNRPPSPLATRRGISPLTIAVHFK